MKNLDTLVADFSDIYKLKEQDKVSINPIPSEIICQRRQRIASTEQREQAKQVMIEQNKEKGDEETFTGIEYVIK